MAAMKGYRKMRGRRRKEKTGESGAKVMSARERHEGKEKEERTKQRKAGRKGACKSKEEQACAARAFVVDEPTNNWLAE